MNWECLVDSVILMCNANAVIVSVEYWVLNCVFLRYSRDFTKFSFSSSQKLSPQRIWSSQGNHNGPSKRVYLIDSTYNGCVSWRSKKLSKLQKELIVLGLENISWWLLGLKQCVRVKLELKRYRQSENWTREILLWLLR